MARLVSPIASIIRGSIAGITFTANQFHQVVARQRTAPVQPNTNGQTVIRSGFVNALSLWNNLDQSDRDKWNDYAKTCQYEGPLGPYTVPGRQLFLGTFSFVYFLHVAYGQPISIDTTPPTVSGKLLIGPVITIPLSAAGTGYKVQIQNDSGEDVISLCQISIGFNQTRERFKGPWLYNHADPQAISDGSGGFSIFDNLTADKRYFNVVRAVSAAAPFRLSNEHFCSSIAETYSP